MSKVKIVIDPIQLGKLAELCCSIEEVAAYFRCSPTTIRFRLQRDPLKTVWETGIARGRISLRRAQLQAAHSGDRAMLIWLGKQLLGQVEKIEQEVKQDQRWVVELPPPMSPEDWVKAFGKPGDGAVDVTGPDGKNETGAKSGTGAKAVRGRRPAPARIIDSTDFSEIDPTKKKAS
jgi:hypothetical protein